MMDDESLGMRHRAGLGISEQADVISLIVSEETGSISIAENGVLYRGLSREGLKNRLSKVAQPPTFRKMRIAIEQFFKREQD